MLYLGLAASITSCTVNTLEIKHDKESTSPCTFSSFCHRFFSYGITQQQIYKAS